VPYAPPEEGLNRPLVDVRALADAEPPPSRRVLISTPMIRVMLLHWPGGFRTVPHRHPRALETFVILEGGATFSIAGERLDGLPGRVLRASPGQEHAIEVPPDGRIVFLSVVAPNEDLPDETIE
jgi:quercetin dioxygenase-like cupin family protein